jgi:hypothetical protein
MLVTFLLVFAMEYRTLIAVPAATPTMAELPATLIHHVEKQAISAWLVGNRHSPKCVLVYFYAEDMCHRLPQAIAASKIGWYQVVTVAPAAMDPGLHLAFNRIMEELAMKCVSGDGNAFQSSVQEWMNCHLNGSSTRKTDVLVWRIFKNLFTICHPGNDQAWINISHEDYITKFRNTVSTNKYSILQHLLSKGYNPPNAAADVSTSTSLVVCQTEWVKYLKGFFFCDRELASLKMHSRHKDDDPTCFHSFLVYTLGLGSSVHEILQARRLNHMVSRAVYSQHTLFHNTERRR